MFSFLNNSNEIISKPAVRERNHIEQECVSFSNRTNLRQTLLLWPAQGFLLFYSLF